MPTHQRIRMFNTRDTYPNQMLDNDLRQAVVAGNTIYLRGLGKPEWLMEIVVIAVIPEES